MSLSEAERRRVYDRIHELFGADADAFLTMFVPDVPQQIEWLGRDLRREMAELRTELRGEMAELRGEMAELRGEVVQLRGHVDSILPKLVAANLASMVGVAGLVLAAGAVL